MEEKQEVEVIHSWSAPRSLSTSLMYSFAQRDDIEVLDEPLYANFVRVMGVERPYREELLSAMDSDGNRVIEKVIFGPGEKRYRYCKHIAKQRVPGLTNDLMKKGKHFILIRNPLHILPSFNKVVPPSFLELGLSDLVSIYSELCELGQAPAIIDAEDLQQNPEKSAAEEGKDIEEIIRKAEMEGKGSEAAQQSTADMTVFVQNLLDQMQSRFQTMSDSIVSKIDEMGTRIDQLEQSINELKADIGIEESPSDLNPLTPKPEDTKPEDGSA